MIQSFRKSIQSLRSVLYEDACLQVGVVADYQPGMVRMRLFFGNKIMPLVTQIGFQRLNQPIGFRIMQSKEKIDTLMNG